MGVLEGRTLSLGYGALAGACFALCGWLTEYSALSYLLLWPGLVFTMVGLAYILNDPRIIGFKDPSTGHLNSLMVTFMFPFYALVWLVWYSRKVTHGARDPSSQHIMGRWYIGRQPLGLGDLPPETGLVVDLTAEFCRLYSLRKGNIEYLCIPSLDTSPPSHSDRLRFIKALRQAAFFTSGNVFVHCANGHGRSAAFLVGMMVLAKIAPTVSEGEKLLKSIRPTIKIRAGQKRFLENVLYEELESRPPGGLRREEGEEEEETRRRKDNERDKLTPLVLNESSSPSPSSLSSTSSSPSPPSSSSSPPSEGESEAGGSRKRLSGSSLPAPMTVN